MRSSLPACLPAWLQVVTAKEAGAAGIIGTIGGWGRRVPWCQQARSWHCKQHVGANHAGAAGCPPVCRSSSSSTATALRPASPCLPRPLAPLCSLGDQPRNAHHVFVRSSDWVRVRRCVRTGPREVAARLAPGRGLEAAACTPCIHPQPPLPLPAPPPSLPWFHCPVAGVNPAGRCAAASGVSAPFLPNSPLFPFRLRPSPAAWIAPWRWSTCRSSKPWRSTECPSTA